MNLIKWLPLFLISFCLSASPVSSLNKQGEGEMNYLFWTLYQAEYFKNSSSTSDSHAKEALRITYQKSISRQALIDATHDQWVKLGYKDEQVSGWLTSLSTIWPNVEPGDQLTLVVTPSGHSEFYLYDRMIGSVPDKKFGEAFLSIWLSENTSEPKLRKQLLGGQR